MSQEVLHKWATAYDCNNPEINHSKMVAVNAFVTNAARLENTKLEADTILHKIKATDLPEFVKQLDEEGYTLLVYVDNDGKGHDSSHEKIKELKARCKRLRIQHILYKSIRSGNASANVNRAIADSLVKMKAASIPTL